jgi:hypothetical protein
VKPKVTKETNATVSWIVDRAVYWTVNQAVSGAVHDVVYWAVYRTVRGAVYWAVDTAVDRASLRAPHPALPDLMSGYANQWAR